MQERRWHRLIPFAGILLVVVFAVWGVISLWDDEPNDSFTLNQSQVHLGVHSFNLDSQAQVQPAFVTMISSGVRGKVKWVNPLMVPGQTIGKGEPLFKMERFEYQARLTECEAVLDQAKHDVGVEQAEALKAIKKTYSDIANKGSESELVLRVSNRRAVASRLAAAEACVKEAQQRLENTAVVAPYTCKVVSVSGAEGSRIEEGQALATIIPVQERVVHIPIPLEDYAYLSQLDSWKNRYTVQAYLILKSGDKLWWKGQITGVNAVLDTEKDSAMVVASLEPNLKMPKEWVIPPVNLKVNIILSLENIPSTAWIASEYLTKDKQFELIDAQKEKKFLSPQIIGYKDGRFLVQLPQEAEGCELVAP